MATSNSLFGAHRAIRGAVSNITAALTSTYPSSSPTARAESPYNNINASSSRTDVFPRTVTSKLSFSPLLVGVGDVTQPAGLTPRAPATAKADVPPRTINPPTWPKSIPILRRPSPAANCACQSIKPGQKKRPCLAMAPPKGDIFSTFGVVMTSNRSHAPTLRRFLDSMVKFCSDCDRAKMLVIVPSKDLGAFTEIRNKHGQQLPKLEFVPFNKIFPAINKALEGKTPGWPRGWSGWDEDKFVNGTNVPMYQSLQKLYGCLHLAREYCTLLDSSGFFVRYATIADIYGGFRKSPYYLYSSYFRHRHPATQAAAKILGYEEEWGWTLEEHNWSVDTNILAELERIIHEARPSLQHLELGMSIETMYWVYLMHNRHRYSRFLVFDTANLFGFQVIDGMRRLGNWEDDWYSPWEDLRWYLEKDPKLIDLAVNIVNKNKFKMYRSSEHPSSVTFLERAASIVMCVGEQPEKIYNLAMQGVFNKGGDQMEDNSVEDSLKR
ncbi:hypothetical protein BCR44DRAFT_1425979 [Catenaria anguillulae PL171]|uniref:Uncharacterized protein n=1 Tax=Catenaria anguillulae PL171 TaxID=765915 RepID=A0A1Y2HZB9_9FUNG|nr:hypothetical protein BCR44DRAFT_1425979 [Catenaria anguillulae PL171]